MYRAIILVYLTHGLVFLSAGCKRSADSYKESIETWQQERLASLVKPDGWVTLAGLFPLEEGIQCFGSDTLCPVHFPAGTPPEMGTISVNRNTVEMHVNTGVNITIDGHPVQDIRLEPRDTTLVCTYQNYQWFLINRGGHYLVRLRDTEHPARQSLRQIPYFPIDTAWRFQATFHPYDTQRTIQLPNALDMIVDNQSPGYIRFDHLGQSYELIALDGGPDELFLLFYDETSGLETYGGGRYLYVDKPVSGNQITLDFNKAYNPPCAFTTFATCLLPPLENRLPFAITAGEKDPHFLEHDGR